MEYASILMLLKKRRKPVRTIDEGLSTVMPGLGRNGELARRGQRGSHRQNKVFCCIVTVGYTVSSIVATTSNFILILCRMEQRK